MTGAHPNPSVRDRPGVRLAPARLEALPRVGRRGRRRLPVPPGRRAVDRLHRDRSGRRRRDVRRGAGCGRRRSACRGTCSPPGSSARSCGDAVFTVYELGLDREPPLPSVGGRVLPRRLSDDRARDRAAAARARRCTRAGSPCSTRRSSRSRSRRCSGSSSSATELDELLASGARLRQHGLPVDGPPAADRARAADPRAGAAVARLLAAARGGRALGAADEIYLALGDNTPRAWLDCIWLASYVVWGAAALDVSTADASLRDRSARCRASRRGASLAARRRAARRAGRLLVESLQGARRPRLGRRPPGRARSRSSSSSASAGSCARSRPRGRRARRAPRGRGDAAAARGAERAAARARPAEGRVRLERLARAAHAAHADHGLRRAPARGRDRRAGASATSRSSSATRARLLELVERPAARRAAPGRCGQLELERGPVDLAVLARADDRDRPARGRRGRRRASSCAHRELPLVDGDARAALARCSRTSSRTRSSSRPRGGQRRARARRPAARSSSSRSPTPASGIPRGGAAPRVRALLPRRTAALDRRVPGHRARALYLQGDRRRARRAHRRAQRRRRGDGRASSSCRSAVGRSRALDAEAAELAASPRVQPGLR